MLLEKPKVSIVTVVFNNCIDLERTILSVINQSYSNFEYIIIDGGSTDGTLDVIKKYENSVDYWISEEDRGIYDAMNKGIKLATGDWINFMNAGDSFFDLNVLEKIFSNFKYLYCDILFGNHEVIYPSGRKRKAKAGSIKDIWKGSQFCHQASFTRLVLHKSKNFSICKPIVGDFDFFYNAWKSGMRYGFLDTTVVQFEAGGFSDVNRIESILGFWLVVDKTTKINIFYIYLILKEVIKIQIKRYA